ncbi:MAG TPA: YraN family protein [Crocinitomicaceae bacterium]|nr:YraN family protein [Crocinitomicaceae bacterium]
MSTHIDLGKKGESVAQTYLLEKGYELLCVNYRFQHLEIDLIFQDKETLVFVEVKARNTTEYGQPYEAVTRQKQKLLIRAANHYIFANDIHLDARFDVVSIVFSSDGNYELEHIVDAFVP